jgi:hypothetical protein
MCKSKKKEIDQKKTFDDDEKTSVSLMIRRIDSIRSVGTISTVNAIRSVSKITANAATKTSRKMLDLGATDHIFCNKESFISYENRPTTCETGTGERFISERIGTMKMTLMKKDDGSGRGDTTQNVTLSKVLYSSLMQYNLISTIKLARKRVETLLSLLNQTSQLLKDGDIWEVADMMNDQYVLREKGFIVRKIEVENETFKAMTTSTSNIQTWHARLGYLGYDNVLKLKNHSIGIQLKDDTKSTEVCGSCMIERQKRNINKTPRIKATKFIEIVHTDLGGPLSLTRRGHAYYITFRDD